MATYTFLALGSALVLILVDRTMPRILGLAAVGALAFVAVNTTGFLIALLALFVPTLVHVYVFTGFFIIYGALKERSRSGYLSFAIFLACPVACWLIHPAKLMPSAYVTVSYFKNFALINMAMLGIDAPQTQGDLLNAARSVFESDTGLIVMRFIAFAYTYHYLNWFSKTSIIRWHQVGKQRLALVGTLWLASVALYIYNYSLGFKVLFCLSFMHLYLEFPLNHISIIGTFKEVRSRFASRGGRRSGFVVRRTLDRPQNPMVCPTGISALVVHRLLFHVIENQDGNDALLLFELEPKLFGHGVK